MRFDPRALDPVLESRVRVGVLALLANGDRVDFTHLRDRLGVTDGNLATHLRRLEEARYVTMHKGFVGRQARTQYSVTGKGRDALKRHVAMLADALGGGA